MYTIAIIDDDVHIGNMLEEILRREDYATLRAYSGTEALLLLARHTPDLVLLDLMLPGLSGEEVLPSIQGIPVIILSAKAAVDDKVGLLLGGAVDYMTKPFEPRELLARIQVQLRANAVQAPARRLQFDGLCLDDATRQVTVDDTPVHLTRTEYAILKQLLQNPAQVIPKSRLLDLIGEDAPDGMESSLKVHISNLRGKLRGVNGRDYIEAVWGIGFKLRQG